MLDEKFKFENWVKVDTKKKTDNNKILKNIIRQVKMLPVQDVLAKYGTKPVRYSGTNILALCPFHVTDHVGSFVINTVGNYCSCFACGNGGDSIHAMMKIWNKSYEECVLQIACDFEIITAQEYIDLSGIKYEKKGDEVSYIKPVEVRKRRPSKQTLTMYTRVYEFIFDWFGLSNEDRRMLENDRHISTERIEKDYCTFDTTDDKTVSRLMFALKQKFPEYAEDLAKVPGLFESKRKDDWILATLSIKAIGILLRNADGDVVAVQLRDKDPNAVVRYKYFSFKAGTNNKYCRGGGTVGTPIDVIIPENNAGIVAVVEGRFKAERLAEEGFITLSVQGVNNFVNIDKDIKAVEAVTNQFIKEVYVFYDADQLSNGNVFKAGIKLGNYIEEHAKKHLNYVIWNPDFGKGIDDLIVNGYKNTTRKFEKEYYENTYYECYGKAEELSGIKGRPIASLTKEDRSKFCDYFERLTRNKFGIPEKQ